MFLYRNTRYFDVFLQPYFIKISLKLKLISLYYIFNFPPNSEEFVQTVQSTAGMAMVLLIRTVMGNGDDAAITVSVYLIQ